MFIQYTTIPRRGGDQNSGGAAASFTAKISSFETIAKREKQNPVPKQ